MTSGRMLTDMRRNQVSEGAKPERNALCAQFNIKGASSFKPMEVLFVPEGVRLTPQRIVELATRTWKLTLPNVLLTLDAGTAHPRAFASYELCALQQFERIWEEAMLQAQRRRQADQTEPAAEEVRKRALGLVNDVLWQKLVTIFAAALDSAVMSNNWILIDRTSAKSPAAELLLEAALAQTASRPTVLVIDTLERLGLFSSETTADHLEALQQLRAKAEPLGSDAALEAEVLPPFYRWEGFLEPSDFYEAPLPREAEAGHLREDGSVSDRIKWQYHFLQTCFGSGTHYVLLDTFAEDFDASAFGPLGIICANGQGMMFDRLKGRIQNGEALVMLHNTGGVTQAFASLHRALLSSVPPPDAKTLLGRLELVSPEAWTDSFGLPEITMMKELMQRAPQLLRKTVTQVDVLSDSSEEVLSQLTTCFASGGGVPELGLGEAETMTALTAWKRHMSLWQNGRRFNRRADVLQALLYLLGVTTTICAVLFTENRTDRQLQRLMIILPIAVALLSTLRSRLRSREKFATCHMAAHQVVGEIYQFRLRTLQYDTFMTPSEDDPDAEPDNPMLKEAQVRDAFVRTVQQVYSHAFDSEVSKGGALSHNATHRIDVQTEDTRGQFATALAAHASTALYGGKGRPSGGAQGAKPKGGKDSPSGGAQGGTPKGGKDSPSGGAQGGKPNGGKDRPSGGAQGGKPEGGKDSPSGGAHSGKPKRGGGLSKVVGNKGGHVRVGLDLQAEEGDGARARSMAAVEVDDFVSPLSIETYVDFRVRPMAAYLEAVGPRLARQMQGLEMLSQLANAAGATLAVLGYAEWVALTVAISAVFNALSDYYALTQCCTAANGALADVHNLLSWWDSLSLVQRKTRAVKAKCATVAEGAILSLISAQTGLPAAIGVESSGAQGEEDDKNK